MTSGRRRPLVLVASALCSAALLVSTAAPASASGPWLGVYDCNGVSAYMLNALNMQSHGRYQYGMSRRGKRLNNPVAGKWKLRGKKIIFTSGVYHKAGYSGVWNPPGDGNSYAHGFIAIKNKQGYYANIACYPVVGS